MWTLYLQSQVGWLQHDFGHLSVFKASWLDHLFHFLTIGCIKVLVRLVGVMEKKYCQPFAQLFPIPLSIFLKLSCGSIKFQLKIWNVKEIEKEMNKNKMLFIKVIYEADVFFISKEVIWIWNENFKTISCRCIMVILSMGIKNLVKTSFDY